MTMSLLELLIAGKSTGLSGTLAGLVVIIWVFVTLPHSCSLFHVTVHVYSCTCVELYSCTVDDKQLNTVISCP